MNVKKTDLTKAALALGLGVCFPMLSGSLSKAVAADTPYAYEIKLSFSAEAIARMKGLKQKITVSNAFYGDAVPAAKARADSGNELDMGFENSDVKAVDQTLRVTGQPLKRSVLRDIVDQKPYVLINVISGPSGANQLSCGVFEDHIAVAQTQPVDIHCEAVPEDLVGKE